jgi:hypothetical protein
MVCNDKSGGDREEGGWRGGRYSIAVLCSYTAYVHLPNHPSFTPTPVYAFLTGLKDIEAANEAAGSAGAAGDVGALQAAFEGLMRLVKLHMRQEDEVSEAAAAADLYDWCGHL